MRSTPVCPTLIAGLLLTFAVGGCHPHTVTPAARESLSGSAADATEGELTVQSTLYFGMNSPDGRGVSEQCWNQFLDEFVTPRFPDGLTVVHGTGQYRSPPPPRGDGKLTIEPSRVVVIVHDGSTGARERVHEIAAEYARRFGQESVLRVDQRVEVRFESAG